MAENIDVDNIWRILGKRYTVLQIIYAFFIAVYMAGFPMLVYVFVGEYMYKYISFLCKRRFIFYRNDDVSQEEQELSCF